MAQWTCKCGNAMNDHRCPDENNYWVFADSVLAQAGTCGGLPAPAYDVYVCPVCGRLSVFGGGETVKFYHPEHD